MLVALLAKSFYNLWAKKMLLHVQHLLIPSGGCIFRATRTASWPVAADAIRNASISQLLSIIAHIIVGVIVECGLRLPLARNMDLVGKS